MKIDGRCHCGAISYVADINPALVIICHCTDCQTISGGPYRANEPVKATNFALRGQPKIYTKTAESGQRMNLAFCGDCGAALFSHKAGDDGVIYLHLGAVAQRAELVPKGQFWCRSALPWAQDINGIPGRPEQSLRPRQETDSN
jgi:hypothetical protein